MYKSYSFLRRLILFNICNIFYVLKSKITVFIVSPGTAAENGKIFWKGSTNRSHRHNAQYYYSKRSSSESPVRKSIASSHLTTSARRERGTVRSRTVEERKSVCIICGHLDAFGRISRKNVLFPDLITINI